MCPKSQILCSTLPTNSVENNFVKVFLVKNCLGTYVNLCAYTQIQVKFTADVISVVKKIYFTTLAVKTVSDIIYITLKSTT